ncbi:MAG: hypothetical protein OXG15_05070 [Gammaproteobacteria bacterium]|nr:hypothetical protein [Gammaproteobacteria bacterium]
MNLNADEPDPSYARFLEASPPQDDIACAYTMTHSSADSGVRVERFSPERRWRLISVDGSEPSESELVDYEAEADERMSRRNSPTDLEFLSKVKSGTVKVDRENAETIEFVFVPEMGEDIPDEMAQKMSGRLTVAKDSMRPMKSMISLNEPASPMTGVKIRRLEQEAIFVKDHATGATLVKSMNFEVHGRAFVVKRISQQEKVAFSEFDCKLVEAQPIGP